MIIFNGVIVSLGNYNVTANSIVQHEIEIIRNKVILSQQWSITILLQCTKIIIWKKKKNIKIELSKNNFNYYDYIALIVNMIAIVADK